MMRELTTMLETVIQFKQVHFYPLNKYIWEFACLFEEFHSIISFKSVTLNPINYKYSYQEQDIE